MASRFVDADNDVIEELKNTRKSTSLLVGVSKKWASLIKEHRRRHGYIRDSRT
jgi:hypothetical protein